MKSGLPKFQSTFVLVYYGKNNGIVNPEEEWSSPQFVTATPAIRWVSVRKFRGQIANLFRCEKTGIQYLLPFTQLRN